MASQYLRILPITGLTASQEQANADIIDVGAYTTLEIGATFTFTASGCRVDYFPCS